MKRWAFGFAVLGLIGCFLPLGHDGASWFDYRHLDPGWTMWLVIAAFAVPVLLGLGGEDRSRGGALVSLACFGYVTYKLGQVSFDLVIHGAIGGRMMGVAVIGGIISSAIGLAATKPAR